MAEKTRIPVNGSGGHSRSADGSSQAANTGHAPGTKADDASMNPAPQSARRAGEKGSDRPSAEPGASQAAPHASPHESEPGRAAPGKAAPAKADAVRIAELESAVAEASRARDEYLDALQRLQAEFDNYRRRARREVGDASETARVALLADFLPVLDNLERALSAAEHHEEGKVLEGVRLTRSQFVELLRREGVEEVDPRGTEFDPMLHEAMLAKPAQEPEGTVVDVFEKGYTVGGRVLRPARVVVSSGAPATAG